jgi:hypothetical protein
MTTTGEEKRESVGLWILPSVVRRARAASTAVGEEEGYGSFSEMVERALLKETRRLERKHNSGDPWPPAAPGTARRGRPPRRK